MERVRGNLSGTAATQLLVTNCRGIRRRSGNGRTGGTWIFEDSIFRYNTSDGLDLLYARNAGSSIQIKRTMAYGNAGNAIKVNGDTAIENSLLVGNCGFFNGKSWLSCSPASGTDSGAVTVRVDPSGLSSGAYTGAVTVSASIASNSPQTVSVTLKVYDGGSSSSPFGSFDSPVNGATVMGFLGEYRFLFVVKGKDGALRKRETIVRIEPKHPGANNLNLWVIDGRY